MQSKNGKRKSGIALVGDLPWGTHFCQFYRTRKDLLDILVPYFKAGPPSRLAGGRTGGGAPGWRRAMVLLSQDEEQRALRFYQSRGWGAVQEVLVYRRPQAPVPHRSIAPGPWSP